MSHSSKALEILGLAPAASESASQYERTPRRSVDSRNVFTNNSSSNLLAKEVSNTNTSTQAHQLKDKPRVAQRRPSPPQHKSTYTSETVKSREMSSHQDTPKQKIRRQGSASFLRAFFGNNTELNTRENTPSSYLPPQSKPHPQQQQPPQHREKVKQEPQWQQGGENLSALPAMPSKIEGPIKPALKKKPSKLALGLTRKNSFGDLLCTAGETDDAPELDEPTPKEPKNRPGLKNMLSMESFRPFTSRPSRQNLRAPVPTESMRVATKKSRSELVNWIDSQGQEHANVHIFRALSDGQDHPHQRFSQPKPLKSHPVNQRPDEGSSGYFSPDRNYAREIVDTSEFASVEGRRNQYPVPNPRIPKTPTNASRLTLTIPDPSDITPQPATQKHKSYKSIRTSVNSTQVDVVICDAEMASMRPAGQPKPIHKNSQSGVGQDDSPSTSLQTPMSSLQRSNSESSRTSELSGPSSPNLSRTSWFESSNSSLSSLGNAAGQPRAPRPRGTLNPRPSKERLQNHIVAQQPPPQASSNLTPHPSHDHLLITRTSNDRLAPRPSRERLVLRPSKESLRPTNQQILSSSTSTLGPPQQSQTSNAGGGGGAGGRHILTQLTSDEATLIASMRRKRAAMAKLSSTEFLPASHRTSLNTRQTYSSNPHDDNNNQPYQDEAFERGLRRLGKRDKITRLTPPAIPQRTSSVRATEIPILPLNNSTVQDSWKGKERAYDDNTPSATGAPVYLRNLEYSGSRNGSRSGSAAGGGGGGGCGAGSEGWMDDVRRRSSTTRGDSAGGGGTGGERDSVVRRSGARDVLMAWDGLGGSARGSARVSVVGSAMGGGQGLGMGMGPGQDVVV